jgi:hypothetical protein
MLKNEGGLTIQSPFFFLFSFPTNLSIFIEGPRLRLKMIGSSDD